VKNTYIMVLFVRLFLFKKNVIAIVCCVCVLVLNSSKYFAFAIVSFSGFHISLQQSTHHQNEIA
jgi:hypothetical protein